MVGFSLFCPLSLTVRVFYSLAFSLPYSLQKNLQQAQTEGLSAGSVAAHAATPADAGSTWPFNFFRPFGLSEVEIARRFEFEKWLMAGC
jgi:hypothetical protein